MLRRVTGSGSSSTAGGATGHPVVADSDIGPAGRPDVVGPPPGVWGRLRHSLWAWPAVAIVLIATGGQLAGVGAAVVLAATAVTVVAAGLGRVMSRETRVAVLVIVLLLGLGTYFVLAAGTGSVRGPRGTSGGDAGPVDLRGRVITAAMLGRLGLRGALLQGATLADLDLRSTALAGADARGASFRYANLSGVDVRGADLRGADLRSSCLRGADFSGARLDGADTTGADVREVVGSTGAGAVGWGTPADRACG